MSKSDSPASSNKSTSDEDEDGPAAEYGDVHRMIVQGFMSYGFLGPAGVKGLFKEAYKRCGEALPKGPGDQMLASIVKVVKEINNEISRFNFVIRNATCEFSGKTSYLFTVVADTQLMRMQTYFSKVEVEMFKKGYEEMMADEDFSIGWASFTNLALAMNGKVSVAEATKVMEKMLAYHYFAKRVVSEQGDEFNLTLGIRAVVELEPIISEDYPEALVQCQLCRKNMLHGYICPRCPYALHMYCYKKYVKNTKACPGCNHRWIDEKTMVRRKKDNDKENEGAGDLNETSDLDTAYTEDEADMDTQPTPPLPFRGVSANYVVDSDLTTEDEGE